MNLDPTKNISISIFDMGVGLGVAFVLGFFIAFIHRFERNNYTYEKSLGKTLIMISPIVAVIMMMIGSNLALSLGMVGALSIIRFRTVIKESKDMIYLFWGIAAGLGCGTNNLFVIALASLLIGLILFLLSLAKGAELTNGRMVVIVRGENLRSSTLFQVVSGQLEGAILRSQDLKGHRSEIVFEGTMGHAGTNDSIVDALKATPGVEDVSLLSPKLILPA